MIDFYLNNPDNKLRNNLTNTILLKNDSLDYHKSLEGYLPTTLYKLNNLSSRLNIEELYVKDESKRFGLNAFKALGASYAIYKQLIIDPSISTFCTATDGNHGRAVAWSANRNNKKSIIYVPKQTTSDRIKAIAGHGAEVIQLDLDYEETCKYALEMSNKMNWKLLQDASWDGYEEIPAYIMSGYLTHFIEMEDSINSINIPNIDIVFLQAGVGSWAASCIWYYLNRYKLNKPKIVLVEPENSSGILQSLLSNKRITPTGNFDTIMAGLNCGIPSKSGWNIIKNGCDAALTISDEYAKKSMRSLFYPINDDKKIISGESGAAGLGGLFKLIEEEKYEQFREHIGLNSNSRVLVFSTEGDTDKKNFNSIIN
ncbi:MAG: diaminopropionate ammonia-lyase [Flavobacteriaceae bacterium]|nr:diaminopropionate ammonia-lyase [Flavobacteriaceae bacterium]